MKSDKLPWAPGIMVKFMISAPGATPTLSPAINSATWVPVALGVSRWDRLGLIGRLVQLERGGDPTGNFGNFFNPGVEDGDANTLAATLVTRRTATLHQNRIEVPGIEQVGCRQTLAGAGWWDKRQWQILDDVVPG